MTQDQMRPGPRWHSVEVVTTTPGGDTLKRKVEGDDVWCAASLRALADQLDPPKPSRPGLREVMTGVSDSARRGGGGIVVLPQVSDVPHNNPMSTR